MVERPPNWEDDPDAPPTEEELAESARLRQALEDRASDHPDAALARALGHAHDPRPLDELSHRRLLDRFVPRRASTAPIVLALAAAAATIFLVTRPKPEPMIQAHSTEALFKEPFVVGETSKRVDAIVVSRERDLRANRYARWGVK